MADTQNANPTRLPSPFDVFKTPAPQLHPMFPRQRGQSRGAYRAQCTDRMTAWVRWVVDTDPLIQPGATDTEQIQRLKRTTIWRVLVRQAEIERGRTTQDEHDLMAKVAAEYVTKLERECVDDIADRLADRALNGEQSGYLLGGIFAAGGR